MLETHIPPSRNWKEQLGMAHTTDPAAIVVDQETLIQGVAKHFVQKVFGLEGMPWGTKFSDLEELAIQIGQAVSQSMMTQALAGQAQSRPRRGPDLWSLRDGREIRSPARTTGRDHHRGHSPLE